jgi:Sec-independent protein secretion pathway component TatC
MSPFLSHFSEMQARIFYSQFSFTITFLFSFHFSTEMIFLFTTPILSFDKPFLSTHLAEPLYATLQICGGIALLVVYPLLLYHLWSFLLSSLFSWERRRRTRIFQFSFFFLSLSLSFVYQFFIPLLLQFFFQFEIGEEGSVRSPFSSFPKTPLVTFHEVGTGAVEISEASSVSEGGDEEVLWKERGFRSGGVRILIEPRIGPFVSWCFHIFFISSLLSQTPLLLFYLYRTGLLTPSLLFKNRKSAFLFLLIGTSLLSPPDFWSQLLLLLFFFTIYEISIWFSFFLEGRKWEF